MEIGFVGAGHMHLRRDDYHGTDRRGDDGEWRISSKRNIRLRLDHVSPAQEER